MSFESVRNDFPIKRERVYLNNASIAPCSSRVTTAVTEFLSEVQMRGRRNYPNWCRHVDETARARAARLIGAEPSEIAWVPNTTQGICLVANGLEWRHGDNVIIANIEYASNVYPWMNLKDRGVEVRWVEASEGRVETSAIERLIDRRTRLISLSSVQFSNGFRLDLDGLCELRERHKVLVHLDAIQHLGALAMDVSAHPVDFLSAGGHKWLLGPIGSGIFYCRGESLERLKPSIVGYHTVDKPLDHSDFDLTPRPGAARFEEALVNFPGIYGLDRAIETILELGVKRVEGHILGLASLAIEGLNRKGFKVLSSTKEGERSGIVAFQHPTIPAAEIDTRLQDARIDVAIRRDALRISPSFYNDEAEIEKFLEVLPER